MKRWGLLLLLLFLLFGVDLFVGSVSIPFTQAWDALWHSTSQDASVAGQIIHQFRLPKALTALLAGISLALCGVQMQTLFRNPLADPYVLGISSGAGLGVALFVMGLSFGATALSLPTWATDLGTAAAALLGAGAVTALVMVAAAKIKNTLSLLVLGIMIGSAGSALIGLMQYVANAEALKMYVLWTMGSFANVTGSSLWVMATLCLAGWVLALYNCKDLNVLLMGQQYAESLGLNTVRIQRRILLSTALLAGSVTAFCGPIGFIGIAVPHVARFVFRNANHRVLLPAAALIGGGLMLLSDILSQLPGTSQVLPINTVAALLGVPVILYVIIHNRTEQS